MIETSSTIFFAGIVGFIIIWFIIAIAAGVWIYRDAESRGMGGALWLVVALVTGIIGLVIYLIVRKPKTAATA